MELSRRRKWSFRLVTLVTPLLVLGLIEGICRLASPWVSDDPYLSLYGTANFIAEDIEDGVPVARVTHDQIYRGRDTTFPVEKSDNTVRVFALGGSASAGWPHPPSEIYSVYLENALASVFPDNKIEVINASGHAYPSYRVRLVFEEILEYDPDLIIVYSGNNEFIEDRTYGEIQERVRPLLDLAHKSAAFRLAKQLAQGDPGGDESLWADWRGSMRFSIWSKVTQRALRLRNDPEQFESVTQHYRYSIDAISRKARRRGIPVILATVPVNIRDWRPNVSVESLSGSDIVSWRASYEEGRRALLNEDFLGAAAAFQQAIELDSQHAESRYYLARALEKAGKYAEAATEYIEARDQDRNPFRAVSQFNSVLGEISKQIDGVYLADLDAAFQKESAPYAPGFNFFLDYVHPNKRGNLIIAATLLDKIVEEELLGPVQDPARSGHVRGNASEDSTYNELQDYPMQGTLLRLFGQMHQYEAMVSKAKLLADMAVETEPAEERLLWDPDATQSLVLAVLDVFPYYLELQRQLIIGTSVPPADNERITHKVANFYREQYGDYRYELSEAADGSVSGPKRNFP